MPNAIENLLANILNPGGRMSAAGGNMLERTSQGFLVPSATQPGMAPAASPEIPPQMATQSDTRVLGQPMPQQPQNAPPPSGGGMGGIGGILGGIGNLFNPEARGRNQTASWLQQQGLDEGTATFLAGNKQALQQYLLDKTKGADPMDALKLEKTQLEIDQMRNPTTDDVREYQFAKQQGYAGNFTDFMQDMRKAGATNVTVGGGKYGTIPTGYELKEGPEGATLVPIPGGPAEAEQLASEAASGAKEAQTSRYGNVVIEDIDRAAKAIEESPSLTTGLIGQWMGGIAGTPAHKVSRLLETVKANAGFDRLQAMRDSSPTGGALGAVNQTEMSLLQSAIGNLEQSQTSEDLIYNLRRVQDIYNEIIRGPGGAPKGDSSGSPRKIGSEEEYLRLPKGAKFIAPDGTVREKP